jgi:histidine ammonia-lyase
MVDQPNRMVAQFFREQCARESVSRATAAGRFRNPLVRSASSVAPELSSWQDIRLARCRCPALGALLDKLLKPAEILSYESRSLPTIRIKAPPAGADWLG